MPFKNTYSTKLPLDWGGKITICCLSFSLEEIHSTFAVKTAGKSSLIPTYPRYQFDFLKSVRIELAFSVGNAICSSAGRSQHKTAAISHEHGSFLRGKKQRGRRCDGWFIAPPQQVGTIRKVFVVTILVLLNPKIYRVGDVLFNLSWGMTQNMVLCLLKEIIDYYFMWVCLKMLGIFPMK